MIRVDLKQGSDEWFQEKLGKPSASNFDKIVCRDGKPSKQRESYLFELVAERLTGKRSDSYKNEIMQEGNDRESESRNLYELLTDLEVEECGVIYKNEEKKFLCSPDGLCNGSGLELKNVLGKTQVKYLLANRLPPEYFAQVQGSLFITGFETWDFMSYCPGIEPFLITVSPDLEYQSFLCDALEEFCSELDNLYQKLKN